MLVSELVRRSLRLINVPGRGKALAGDDLQQGCEELSDLIASEAVSQQFVPGIRKHFFPMLANQGVYTYGPGGLFDTRARFDDPAPIRIEQAYIREGTVLIDNTVITNGDLDSPIGWQLGNGWIVQNGRATLLPNVPGTHGFLTQDLVLVTGTRYEITVDFTQREDGIAVWMVQDGVAIKQMDLLANGVYRFDFTFGGVSQNAQISFRPVTPSSNVTDVDINRVEMLPAGVDRYALPDSQGSDYWLTPMDQNEYNRRFTKGTGGRPYRYQYVRNFPLPEIRFDNSALSSDILIMDVLCDRVSFELPSDDLRLFPEEVQWLKYELANQLAPQYGKELTRTQMNTLDAAWNLLAAGQHRPNRLRVDRALRKRPTFDINRGDP